MYTILPINSITYSDVDTITAKIAHKQYMAYMVFPGNYKV